MPNKVKKVNSKPITRPTRYGQVVREYDNYERLERCRNLRKKTSKFCTKPRGIKID